MRGIVAQHFRGTTSDHIRDLTLVVAEIGNRTDRFRQKEEAVGEVWLGTFLSLRATSMATTTPLRSSFTMPGWHRCVHNHKTLLDLPSITNSPS